ncbi:MAG: hypothetical protein HFE74_04745 [Firmicutes bacterium]|jgi:hypothetical protein|nr:hypothetical protein [Bacillota bacterium]
MKNRNLVMSIYVIVFLVYGALELLLVDNRDAVFWTGLEFMALAVIGAALTVMNFIKSRDNALPIRISIIYISNIYILLVIGINIFLDNIGYKKFLAIHIACCAIFVIIILLMFVSKLKINKIVTDDNSACIERKVLESELEKVKMTSSYLPYEIKKEVEAIIDDLLEKMRFSNFNSKADLIDLNNEISRKIQCMASEIDYIIQTQTNDISSVILEADQIKNLIKQRDIQIEIMNV